MNLSKPLLEELFNKQIRFRIPVFQRHYVWNELEQWKPLWDDFVNKVNERLSKQKNHPHYTGSIVLFQETTTTTTVSTYSVIDGQQRLTTFQIFIASFREVCRKHLNDPNLISELEKLLFNEKSFGEKDYEKQKFKLEPTKFNKEMFNAILSLTYDEVNERFIEPLLEEYGVGPKTYRNIAKTRNNILGAYLYFYDQIQAFIKIPEHNLEEVIKQFLLVLKRDFQFVEIGLLQNDDPQMIFETMNGRGATLTETDLIRNYIFMRANSRGEDLDSIYDEYWNEFNDPTSKYKWHEKVSRGRYNDSKLQFFVVDYLTLKLQSEVRYDQVFYNYKNYVINHSPFNTIESELQELHSMSKIFQQITNPEGNSMMEKFASRLLDFDMSTIYPLLLFIGSDAGFTKAGKDQIIGYLDSYVTRRFLCGYTNKNYNNVFLELLKFLTEHKDPEQFRQHLVSKSADSNLWPTDHILLERLLERPIYREERNKSRSICNILLEIEHSIRGPKQEKATFKNDGLTIEHILPQTWYEFWPLEGELIEQDVFDISVHAVMTEEDKNGIYHRIEERNKALHTIGNLTLLTNSLNPAVSNGAYDVKRLEIANNTSLMLNKYFNHINDWNEDQIKARSKALYETIRKIWPY